MTVPLEPTQHGITMSEEKMQELEKLLSRVVVVGWSLLVGAFALGVWVTTIEFRQRDATKVLEVVTSEMKSIELWKAGTAASFWSVQDHTKSMLPIQENMASQDKRIQRVEDAIMTMSKAIDRIENAVAPKKN